MLFATILEHQCSRATTSWETQEWFIFGHPSRSSPGTQGSGSCENQLFARLSNSRYLLGIYSPCEREEFPIPYKNLCRA